MYRISTAIHLVPSICIIGLKLVLCIPREELTLKTNVNVIFCTVVVFFYELIVAMATKVLTFAGNLLKPLINCIA